MLKISRTAVGLLVIGILVGAGVAHHMAKLLYEQSRISLQGSTLVVHVPDGWMGGFARAELPLAPNVQEKIVLEVDDQQWVKVREYGVGGRGQWVYYSTTLAGRRPLDDLERQKLDRMHEEGHKRGRQYLDLLHNGNGRSQQPARF